MHAKLYCRTGKLPRYDFRIEEEATIGTLAQNTIQIDVSAISSKHARIYFDAKSRSYYLEDVGSRNGTRLDGVRVRDKEKLGKLHIITFAEQFDFIFQLIEAEQPSGGLAPAKPAEASKAPVVQPVPVVKEMPPVEKRPAEMPPVPQQVVSKAKDEIPAGARTVMDADFVPAPRFQVSEPKDVQQKPKEPDVQRTIIDDGSMPPPVIPGVGTPAVPVSTAVQPIPESSSPTFFVIRVDIPATGMKSFELHEGKNVIGREEGCDIVIKDDSLSRKHAVLTLTSGKVMVLDLGSKNNTFVDRVKITKETPVTISSVMSFGVVQATLVPKS